MATFKVGIIGCGRPRSEDGSTGFGMGHSHCKAYKLLPDCDVVACADIKKENLEAFAKEHKIPNTYLDYKEMLGEEGLDIVSICTWIALHPEMVIASAEAGVKAIHCEKPMADNFGDSKLMLETCRQHGVQLTFHHQRRFLPTFQKAKELANDGTIGDIVRLEGSCGNIFDWGTHWLDMFFFYLNEAPAEWVIGQIDSREESVIFGAQLENQAISHIMWKNGVLGLLFCGPGSDIGCSNRIIGTKGVIEVGVDDGPAVRYCTFDGKGWQEPEVEGGLHGGDAQDLAIADVVDALKAGREPELAGRRALQATEIIYATYESCRRRGRVDLPLDIEDSPLLAMLEAGEIGPNRKS
jgi:predicted dehydrogenase